MVRFTSGRRDSPTQAARPALENARHTYIMKRARHRVLPALVLGAALTWSAGYADPPAAKPADSQPDAEFLEFLGSVDSASEADDGSWMEYLAQADIDKAAKKASPPGQSANQGASQSDKPAATDDRPPAASRPAAPRDDRPPTASRPATSDRPSSVPADKLESDAKQGASKVKPDGQ